MPRASPTAATPLTMGTAPGRWVVAATIAGSGMVMLDSTVVNVALAQIGRDFGADFTALQWITNAYTLALASLILLGGVLGDQYGRRRVFVVGVVWFALASALCAFSVNTEMLIAARTLQGIGGALLTPGSLAILSASFARGDRARAIGAWSGLGGIASAVGPFLGGWLVGIDWRLVFAINVPLAAVVVWVARRHVPETRDTTTAGDKRRLDWAGTGTVVVALSAFTYAATTAGRTGWTPATLLVALLGLVAGVTFWVVERRSRHPLVQLGMFTDRVFAATNVVTVFVYAGLSLYFFLLVLQLQVVARWSPLAAGTSLLPVTALILVLSARAGSLSERIGPRPLMSVGALLAAVGFVLALRVGADARFVSDVLPSVTLLGLGLSCAVAPLTAAVLGAAPDHLAGAASGINNATARSAGLLAVAVVPAIAGLSGLAVDDAAGLDAGFRTAMAIGAALLLVGAGVSWLGNGRPPTVVGVEDSPPRG